MAVVFLLGPGSWDASKGTPPSHHPMDIRKRIAGMWREDGHTVLLMEESGDLKGETILQKFDRLLRDGVTDVVVYWPPLAKMATTYTELVLLCDRQDFLAKEHIEVWLVHHSSVASVRDDDFKVLEAGNRSRYLEAVTRLKPIAVDWETEDELFEKIGMLSSVL